MSQLSPDRTKDDLKDPEEIPKKYTLSDFKRMSEVISSYVHYGNQGEDEVRAASELRNNLAAIRKMGLFPTVKLGGMVLAEDELQELVFGGLLHTMDGLSELE